MIQSELLFRRITRAQCGNAFYRCTLICSFSVYGSANASCNSSLGAVQLSSTFWYIELWHPLLTTTDSKRIT